MRPFLVVIALAVAGCQAHTQTTHQNYLKTWNDRLETYRERYVELDTQIRQGSERVVEAMGASDIVWTNFAPDFADLGVQIRDAYKIAGRGEALKRFLSHVESRPTPGLSEVWFQEEGRSLDEDAKRVQAITGRFYTESQRINLEPEWILNLEAVAKAQGILEGTTDELTALWSQARSYYGDLQLAQEADRRLARQRAQALFAMGAYLNQLNYQQQMINALMRPRTCYALGSVVTCY